MTPSRTETDFVAASASLTVQTPSEELRAFVRARIETIARVSASATPDADLLDLHALALDLGLARIRETLT